LTSPASANAAPVLPQTSKLPHLARCIADAASAPGGASGWLRFAPGLGDRGHCLIAVIASDDGDRDSQQILGSSRRFVLSARGGSARQSRLRRWPPR
jgi:hypothetical protein